MQPLPFVFTSSKPKSAPSSAGRLINLFAEINPDGAKFPYTLYGVPGRKTFATVGGGPFRAMTRLGESLYVASGPGVYRVLSDGTTTLLGTISTVDPVYMAASKTEVAVAAGGLGYIATTTALTQIADADFPANVATVTHFDGYFIWTRINSGTFNISAVNDGTAYDALDVASNEAHWDNTTRAFANRREVWFFGEKTTEIWYNSGDATFPFERLSGAVMQKGTSNPFSIVEADNTVIWVGDDFAVHRANGYVPQRISTPAVEKDTTGVSGIEAFSYSQMGHQFYVMKVPGIATWAYDFATGLWHERKTQGSATWAPVYGEEIWNKVIVGHDSTLSELDFGTHDELGAEIIARATTAPIGNVNKFTIPRIQLDIEPGVGLGTGQGSDPQVMMKSSKDGGKTWGPEKWRSFGKIGEYQKRALWHRNGQFRSAIFDFTISDPVGRAIQGMYG